ncbi:hypothetical protein EVB91_177 [Rhizobium phage RHph_I1_18]|nr:hypothetical protein EVB91_177 [Rhizobium phage RHph_I1_18]
MDEKTFVVRLTEAQRKILVDALEVYRADNSNHNWNDIDALAVAFDKLEKCTDENLCNRFDQL